jgi:hypothetical protein
MRRIEEDDLLSFLPRGVATAAWHDGDKAGEVAPPGDRGGAEVSAAMIVAPPSGRFASTSPAIPAACRLRPWYPRGRKENPSGSAAC